MSKRRFIQALFTAVLCILIVCLSTVTFFAAGTKMTVNEEQFQTGDTITYILKLSNAQANVLGLNLEVTYDQDALEIDDKSINIPYAISPICNATKPGRIIFNATEAIEGMEFKEEHILISASFKIKDSAKDTKINGRMIQIIDANDKELTESEYNLVDSVIEGTLPQNEIVNPGDGMQELQEVEKGNFMQKLPIIVIAAVVVLLIASVVIINVRKKKSKETGEI